MRVLALDTSNRPLSVAVVEDRHIIAEMTTTNYRQHSSELLPIIEQLMKKAGFRPADLDRVVVASGPGSYTGIRIACTTAKVLAFTLGIQLVGVSSLQTLALNLRANEGALVNPIFDARNDNVYTGLYRIRHQVPELVVADRHASLRAWLEKLKKIQQPVIGIGDADHFLKTFSTVLGHRYRFVVGNDNLPQAAELGLFGEHRTPVKDVNHFIPNYLRLTRAQADWWKKHPDASRESSSYVRMYSAKL